MVYRMRALLPFAGMIMVILIQVGNMVVSKAAMSRGMNKYVLIVYSNALSSLFLLPCSVMFHRTDRPQITFFVLCRFFLLSLIGTAAQMFGYAGIQYSSPTLGTAMLNLIPAFTFVLSIILRLEKLDQRSNSSLAKCLGTIVSITGAFVVTFYKGPPILMTLISPIHPLLSSQQLTWILGGLFLVAEALLVSAWYIVQTLILKKFPAILIITFYITFFRAIQSGVYSLVMVKDPRAWKLRLDIGLFAVLYSAIVGGAICVNLCLWCLWKTGPLYVTMFKPLGIIFAVAMGIIFLGDVLCLGSLIGTIIIVTGFYAVLWGKSKEEEIGEEVGIVNSQNVPLLQDRIDILHKDLGSS